MEPEGVSKWEFFQHVNKLVSRCVHEAMRLGRQEAWIFDLLSAFYPAQPQIGSPAHAP